MHSDPAAQAVLIAAKMTSDGAVKAALIARAGTLSAAKLGATSVIAAALIAGTCGFAGVGVQGYYATRQANIQARIDPPESVQGDSYVEFLEEKGLLSQYMNEISLCAPECIPDDLSNNTYDNDAVVTTSITYSE